MENSQDEERFFIWSIGDKKISHGMKTKRPGSQVGPTMAYLREGNESANRFIRLVKKAVSGIRVISGDKFPNFT